MAKLIIRSTIADAAAGEFASIDTVTATYANDVTTNNLQPTFGGTVVSGVNKIEATDIPGNGAWLYGITTEEHSGLASEEMSEIIRVVVAGGTVTDTQILQAKGKSDFWITLPAAPTNFAAANKDGNDHYVLSWTEPADADGIIRAYSIYYDTTSNPSPVAAKRIATVPKGTASFKDFLANLASKGKWGITSLDKYGNESTILYDDTSTGAAGPVRPSRPGGIPARTSDDFGLTELETRRSRMAACTWGYATMEDGSYVWQPETCMCYDPDTGHEVWRMTSTDGLESTTGDDIGFSQFSANGEKLGMSIKLKITGAYTVAGQISQGANWRSWYTCDLTGANFRALDGAHRYGDDHLHWCPQIPRVLYETGHTAVGTGASFDELYRTTVAANGAATATAKVTLPNNVYHTLDKMITADGLYMILVDETNDILLPVSFTPAGAGTLEDADGYDIERSYGAYGQQDNPVYSAIYHDAYMQGLSTDPWYLCVLSNEGIWWRQQGTGTAADGGPLYTGDEWVVAISNKSGAFTASEGLSFAPSGATGTYVTDDGSSMTFIRTSGTIPTTADAITGDTSTETADIDTITSQYDYGEIFPMSATASAQVAGLPVPFEVANPGGNYDASLCSYMSHVTPSRWGDYLIFNNTLSNLPRSGTYAERIGAGIWDWANQAWIVASFGNGSNYPVWGAFSDWSASNSVSHGVGGAAVPEDSICCHNYTNADSKYTVAYIHTRSNSTYDNYSNLSRPGQSPDGTKISFHSDVLNGVDDMPDVYYCVAYYPYPPTDLEASGSGGTVTLGFLPPSYSTRQWSGATAYAREVKQYRIWRKVG